MVDFLLHKIWLKKKILYLGCPIQINAFQWKSTLLLIIGYLGFLVFSFQFQVVGTAFCHFLISQFLLSLCLSSDSETHSLDTQRNSLIRPKAFVSLYRCVTLRDVNLTYEFVCKKVHSFTTVLDFYTMASFCDLKM